MPAKFLKLRTKNALSFTGIFLCAFVFLLTSVFLAPVAAAPGINGQINFQGKLHTSSGLNVANGSYTVVFSLYSVSSAGTALWTETQTVTVTDGVFQVSLGSVTSLSTVDFAQDTLYLGMKVNADAEMTPRIRFTAVPYAFNSQKVNGLTVTNTSDGAFSSATTLKIGNGKTVVFNNGLTFSGTDSTTFTFPSTSGTVVTTGATQTLTSKTIGSTGLVFSGATNDITTPSGEHLALMPGGTGNVGIGTTTPRGIFDVNSSSTIFLGSGAGDVQLTNGRFRSAITLFQIIGQQSGGSPIPIQFAFTSDSSSPALYLATNGNIGIGTTSPTYKLDVAGTGRFTGNVDATAGLDVTGGSLTVGGSYSWTTGGIITAATNETINGIDINAGALSDIVSLALTTSGNSWTSTGLNVSGNVGIGTTSPGSRLTLASDGTYANLFTITDNGSTIFEVTQSNITANVPVQFNAAGDVSIAYDLNFTNPTASYIKSSAPLYMTAGEAFNSSDLTLRTYNSGNVIVDSQVLSVTGSATVSGQLAVTGNVGIGTNSPSTFKLEVAGHVGPSADSTYDLGTSAVRFRNGYFDTLYGDGSNLTGVTASGVAFSGISSGTNTTAAMIVGAGSSLSFSSTGTINSSSLLGGTWAAPGAIGSSTPNTGAFTTLSSTGATTLGNNSSTVTIDSSSWDISSTGVASGLTGLTSSGTVTFSGLTATRAVFTTTGGQLTVSGTSAALASSLSNETGTGAVVFGTSPSITTALNTGSTTFGLIDTTATTVNFARAATNLTMGATTGTITIQNSTTALTGVLNVNGTGDSYFSGNVGIGTTNPISTLHVAPSGSTGGNIQVASYTALGNELSSAATILGNNVRADTTNFSEMEIIGTHSSLGARAIRMADEVGIAFHTSDGSVTTGDAFTSERMRIDENGNVGIGTTNPGANLDVQGSSTSTFTALNLQNTNTTAGAETLLNMPVFNGTRGFHISQSTNSTGPSWAVGGYDAILRTGQNNSYLHLAAGASNNPQLTINPSGNVGIGTTAPNKKLEVNTAHTSNIDDEIRLGSYYQGNFYGLGLNYQISSTGNPSQHLVTYGGGTKITNMSFSTSGNVGIGSIAPVAKLDVNGQIYTDSTGLCISSCGVQFSRSSNDLLINVTNPANIRFFTNNTEQMRIDSTGNVGIGTTNPGAYKLNVAGAAYLAGNITTTGTLTLPNSSVLTGGSNYLRSSRGLAFGSDETYYINSSGTGSINNLYANRFYQSANGTPTNNLGTPSVTEMALFDEQFTNKTAFYDISNIYVETSTDGVTWSTFAATDDQKRRLVGGDSNSSLQIPYGTNYFRIRFRSTSYAYLNALYSYWSSSGHTTQVHIYKQHDSGTYTQHTSSSTQVSSWPGHLYLPFSTIPFNPNATLGTHYHEVSVVFIPSWNATYSANDITLYKLQLWGGYPAGKRNIYAVDEYQNVTFPGTLAATGGNSTNWNTAYGWGNHASAGYLNTSSIDTYAELNGIVGDVTLTHNGLIDTSAELAGIVTNETGSGALVFGTSPSITTALNTGSTTFSLVNTTATTLNFGGAATNLTMGATTGTTTIRNATTALTGVLNVNGTGNSYFTGNVGIGTTNPEGFRMRVLGNMRLGVAGSDSQLSMLSSSTVNHTITANDWSLAFTNNSGTPTAYSFSNGNVGIGTTTPGYLLHVVDLDSVGNEMLRLSDLNNSLGFGIDSTAVTNWYVNGSAKVSVNIDGNVGIGTTAPVGRLNVNGSGNQKALVQITGDGNQDLFTASASGTTKFVIKSDGRVGVNTSAPEGALNVASSGTAATAFIVEATDGSDWFTIGKNGAGVVAFNQAGGYSLAGTSTYMGARMNIGSLSNSLKALSISGVSGQTVNIFEINSNGNLGGDYMVVNQSGNVGIGTTSPDQKLHVAGGGILLDNAQVFKSKDSSGTVRNLLQLYSDNKTYLDGGTGGFRLRTNNGLVNAMDIDVNGNVGIGTTNPLNKLHVSSTANRTFFVNSSNTEGTSFAIQNTSVGGKTYELAVTGSANGYGAGHFLFWNDTNDRSPLILNANGNVRIGHDASFTATAASPLTVYGGAAIGASYINTAAPSNGLLVEGNVGIGTTNPGAKLDVNGEIKGLSMSGAGLTDCDSSTSKLLWDATTKQFSCGTTDDIIVRNKPSNTTIQSDNTVNNDQDLFFDVGANETWVFRIVILAESTSTADFKAQLAIPAGSNCYVTRFWTGSPTTPVSSGTCETPTNWGMVTGDSEYIEYMGTIVNGGTAGTVQFQWSQVNSEASNTSVYAYQSFVTAYKVTGADLAEVYYTNDASVMPGDIVSVDNSLAAGVKKSEGAYDSNVMGIISTQPGKVLGDGSKSYEGKPVLLGLSGRVPVKVSSENGSIQAGDYITASSVPGVGMKATRGGQIVGRALESYDSEDTNAIGYVTVFIENGYQEPGINYAALGKFSFALSLNSDGNLVTESVEHGMEQLGVTYTLKDDEGREVENKAAYSEAAIGQLSAGTINTKQLIVSGVNILDMINKQESETAVLSSTATPDPKVGALEQDVADLKQKLAVLSGFTQNIASDAAFLKTIIESPLMSASSSALLDGEDLGDLSFESATVSGDLMVLGRTTVSDLGVTGVITTGLLAIDGLKAEINTIGEPLKLQNLAGAGIEMMGGKVTLDTEGNIQTEGKVIAEEIEVKKVTTEKVTIKTEDPTTTEVLTTTAGKVTFKAGQATLEVRTTAITEESLIFTTPERPVAIGAEKIGKNSFRITLESAPVRDLSVNWWIIN